MVGSKRNLWEFDWQLKMTETAIENTIRLRQLKNK